MAEVQLADVVSTRTAHESPCASTQSERFAVLYSKPPAAGCGSLLWGAADAATGPIQSTTATRASSSSGSSGSSQIPPSSSSSQTRPSSSSSQTAPSSSSSLTPPSSSVVRLLSRLHPGPLTEPQRLLAISRSLVARHLRLIALAADGLSESTPVLRSRLSRTSAESEPQAPHQNRLALRSSLDTATAAAARAAPVRAAPQLLRARSQTNARLQMGAQHAPLQQHAASCTARATAPGLGAWLASRRVATPTAVPVRAAAAAGTVPPSGVAQRGAVSAASAVRCCRKAVGSSSDSGRGARMR
ncbi:hypothetical protein FOA52_014077 [Chlamydomonas sp. UWO 241]|nr:hypothetical protein FOA52_014077 [Chlamydomonas sp. UWO 241]